MEGEPRYRLEALHAILLELGCRSEQSRADPAVRAWSNPNAAGPGRPVAIATYRPDSGTLTIPEGHAFALARALRLPDPYRVIALLKERGGEVL